MLHIQRRDNLRRDMRAQGEVQEALNGIPHGHLDSLGHLGLLVHFLLQQREQHLGERR